MGHSIEKILGPVDLFLDRIFEALGSDGIDTSSYELDHICYRVKTKDRYRELEEKLKAFGKILSEVMIGGRVIATFHLNEPILYSGFKISCLELPSPKEGSSYVEGFEHAEFVVDMDLNKFASLYPGLVFDMSSIGKSVNPDISRKYEGISVKFHKNSLEYVIKYLQG